MGSVLNSCIISKPGRPCVSVVTIASSDSGGGAGIQADLLTFAAHGVHGTTVLVAATAQDTRRITGVETLSPAFIGKQIDAVFTDLRPAAVKIGALVDARRIRAVAAGLRRHHARNVVLDPVMASTAGTRLLSAAAVSQDTRASASAALRPRHAEPLRSAGALW